MHACGLPSDVVYGVFEYAASLADDGLDAWRATVPLGGVCQQWRRVGLPLLSRTAVLVHTPATGAWNTNATLLSRSGRTQWIRQVAVCIHPQQFTAATLADLVARLADGRGPWTHARTLRIVVGGDVQSQAFPIARPALAQPADAIVTAAGALVARLPNVTGIRVAGDMPDTQLVRALASAYALQLERVSGGAALLQHRTSVNLTHLSLALDNHASEQLLACVNAGELRALSLTGLASDTVWLRFGAGGPNAGSVRFGRLEQLRVVYDAKVVERSAQPGLCADGGFRLRFPRLRRLDVENCPADSPLLQARVGAELQCVRIGDRSGRVEPAGLLAHAPALELLAVTSYSAAANGEAFAQATNRLFGAGCRATYASLVLGFSSAVPSPARVSWPRLTKLSIFTAVESAVVLGLLAKCPALFELALSGVDMARWAAGAVSQLLATPPAEATASTSVHKIYFGDVFSSAGGETTEFLKYLLVAVPSMGELAFSAKHFEELFWFVKAQAPRFPNMLKIKYDVLC
ncbi:hypothetical protein H4S01_000794 [Coemansia sp. RSA 2610]|nr:hypothetical protein H4S01_000794 [Coemansia sp. RSA 2610]